MSKRVQFVCIGDDPVSHEVIDGVVVCLDRPLASLNGDDITVAPAGAPPCEACQAKHLEAKAPAAGAQEQPNTDAPEMPPGDGDACPHCGALNRPDARQCHKCGAAAPTPD